ncbi:MAG: hypothetical protein ACOY32_16230 [Thermodesulfobacteriota bacterium]
MKPLLVLIGALGALALVSCAGNEKSPASCAGILAARCLGCHDRGRVCERLGRKSRDRWEQTLERMIRRGAELDVAGKMTLINCLDRADDDIGLFCQ